MEKKATTPANDCTISTGFLCIPYSAAVGLSFSANDDRSKHKTMMPKAKDRDRYMEIKSKMNEKNK